MGQDSFRIKEEREQKIIDLLTDIKNALSGTTPPGTTPGTFPTLDQLQTMITEVLQNYDVLQRANDIYVSTIDLGTPNSTPFDLPDLANALSLTIYRNTGSFVLYLQKADDTKKITVDALTYPQTLVIDWLDIKKVLITNAAQTGASAQIIKFFRS